MPNGSEDKHKIRFFL